MTRRRFSADQSGAVAIEFALILPILVTLFFGCFELSQVLQVNNKLQVASATLAQLVAEQNAVTSSAIADFCIGARLVMTPFPGAAMKAAIASVTNTDGTTKVQDWQDTSCGGAGAMGNAVSLAAAMVPNSGDTLIVVSASYNYTSPLSYALGAHFNMAQVAFARPRTNTTVPLN